MNKTKFAHVLVHAQKSAFTNDLVQKSFRMTGIHPFNPEAIDKSHITVKKTNLQVPTEKNTNAQSKDPCSECGRQNPCRSCIMNNNPLSKLGIISDPSGAKVLFRPTLPEKRAKINVKLENLKF